ncbi:MAG: SRPBCC domain-containing protein [Candidatus Thiodiazotropha sp. (ex Ctena orbiculata)]|uniref:SRPBCC domain-containing protein n=1 Tax=Candidatus Thiodiazotropha taylori TaxID=2792791 RepID=A0A944M8A5_9GAMM|nr:SRPBCC domain-containing protein [Candidatus Thiodiazotropha taylori]MBT2989256.1 SRPBCC domain-containing protein [Candidatus Thiodiazotropha taylori]MBT2995535.1 SRPBCC domain-containing protein [Candidatus Thiodiazotropha taylori]MBT2999511.1 SRPBCC domain-containing protein [Candidatus Thiodiazotropha taylori]MBT3025745.1 SRPBCC domain-containing protein [Candidatus Thiodiazotropha taylori]
MTDYRSSICCSVSADRAYRAITQEMSAWWTPMSNRFSNIGDRAKTDFGGPSYWVFEAVTLNSPHVIELLCCESNMVSDSLADPEEWLGTILKFEITEQDEVCTVALTHIGLTPEMACYEICKTGWDHYIAGSLKQHLDGLGGRPNSY